tara:strand:- start:3910 stop:4311 length:402 start_codon:yes stop_codon:yes gene_type:complete
MNYKLWVLFILISNFNGAKILAQEIPTYSLVDTIGLEIVNRMGQREIPDSCTTFIIVDGNTCEKCLNNSLLNLNDKTCFLSFENNNIKRMGIFKNLSSRFQRPVYFSLNKKLEFKEGSFEFGKDIGPVIVKIR